MLTYNIANSQLDMTNTVSRIMVIDKYPIISFAITKLLAHYPYINVVGQCHDIYNILSSTKKCNPSMIIIDPALPFIEGLEAIKQLQRYKPDLQFIVFMQENCTINLEEFIKLNIQGITLKDSNTTSLLSAIHSVCRGFTFLDKALTPYANRSINSLDIHSLNNTLSLPRISPREKQILGLISQGLRNKEIAEKLTISIKTVESHRLNLMKKLDAHSVVDLMKWAIRLNIA